MRKVTLTLVLLFLVACGVDTPSPTPVSKPELLMVEEVTEHILYFPLIMDEEISTPTPTITPTSTPTVTPMPIDSIGNEFLKYDINFGFAVGSNIRTSGIRNELVKYHAKVVTMENDYKMNNIQHVKGVFNFWGADQIILFGNEHNIGVYGHGISWSSYNPDWLKYIPNSELAYELDKHVRTVCSHYVGLDAVDVANEAYMGEGGSLSAGEWSPLGNDYVNISFDSCRDATNDKIFYNSFFWTIQDAQKAVQLLDSGQADGIGVQLHLSEGTDYQGEFNRIRYIIQESRKRGTPVRFSEIGVWATSEQAQALIYRDVIRLALDNSDVVTDFIIWGVNDPAWRGNVTLFKSDGSPKQSAYAILDELRQED